MRGEGRHHTKVPKKPHLALTTYYRLDLVGSTKDSKTKGFGRTPMRLRNSSSQRAREDYRISEARIL